MIIRFKMMLLAGLTLSIAECAAVSASFASAPTASQTLLERSTMSTEALNNTDSASSFISPVPAASRLGGVNIAGFEFGTNKSGYVGTNNYTIPSKNQIAHFVAAGSNVFRLPFGWQYMEPAGPGTGLGGVITSYDSYVQTILSAGAFVILDVHKSVRVLEPLTLLVDLFVLSYGRWDGAIIGSGGPTTMQFANLWSALAGKYANQTNVIFGIMNEPHDQDLVSWTVQVQAAVDAIRAAGATSQYILLPVRISFVDDVSNIILIRPGRELAIPQEVISSAQMSQA